MAPAVRPAEIERDLDPAAYRARRLQQAEDAVYAATGAGYGGPILRRAPAGGLPFSTRDDAHSDNGRINRSR